MRVSIKQILTKRLSPAITATKIPPPALPTPIPTPISSTSSSSFISSGNTSEYSFQTCETSDSSIVSPKSLSRKRSFSQAVRSLSRPPTPKTLGTRSRPQTPSRETIVRRNRSSSTASGGPSIGRKSNIFDAILHCRIGPEREVLTEDSFQPSAASPSGRKFDKGCSRGIGSFVGQAHSVAPPIPSCIHHGPNIGASGGSGHPAEEEISLESSTTVIQFSKALLPEEVIHMASVGYGFLYVMDN
jgi:hypothetical protein